MMKHITGLLFFCTSLAYAGGWSNSATPTRIDIERGNGFMVYGLFGNAGTCTISNRIYIKIAHPQYKEIYSTVLAAFTAGKKLQMYIHGCEPVGWYSVASTTYNIMDQNSSLNLSN